MPTPPYDELHAPDEKRFARVLELYAALMPDADIAKLLAVEFNCHPNTIRSDIRRRRKYFAEHDNATREERRAEVLHLMTLYAQEVLEQARNAADPKARAMCWKLLFEYFGRVGSWYGLSDEQQVKLDILRAKFLAESGMTQEQLDSAIAAEVSKAIAAMPLTELERLVAEKRGAPGITIADTDEEGT